MTKLFEVQGAIFERLSNNEEVLSKVTDIHDAIPEESTFPYIVLGRVYSQPYDTKTSRGWTIEQTIDVWSASKGKKETIGIIESIEVALKEELSVDDAFVFDQRVRSIEVLEEVVDLYRGSFIYEILIDVEGE